MELYGKGHKGTDFFDERGRNKFGNSIISNKTITRGEVLGNDEVYSGLQKSSKGSKRQTYNYEINKDFEGLQYTAKGLKDLKQQAKSTRTVLNIGKEKK